MSERVTDRSIEKEREIRATVGAEGGDPETKKTTRKTKGREK